MTDSGQSMDLDKLWAKFGLGIKSTMAHGSLPPSPSESGFFKCSSVYVQCKYR